MSSTETGFGERFRLAVKAAGGVAAVSSEMGIGKSTLYTYFNETSSPSVQDSRKICAMGGTRPTWLFTGEGPMGFDESAAPELEIEGDLVAIPKLTAPASAGAGAVLTEAAEETGTISLPKVWLRQFGTPARLRLVEIVGNSMAPDLDEGDWMLVNLDLVELRDGIALVRLDDALLVKRLQPQGRTLLLTSSNPDYLPITLDLAKDGDRFAVIGHGRWKSSRLA